jgi:tripartite-type tricarboxylate transporter receptor subunit TctC
VGFQPGGGIDTSARFVARHLPRFIEGNPAVIIQNLDGAAGVVAANYLERRAVHDGLTIAIPGRSWFIEPMLGNRNAQYDPLKLAYVGSTGAMNSLMWVNSNSTIRSIQDVKSAQEPVIFGALGAGTQTAIIGAILAESGFPIKLVSGYPGSSRLLIALQQGEVQAVYLTEDSFLLNKDLIENKRVRPILQSRAMQPGVPLLSDHIPSAKRSVLELATAGESIGMIIVAPSGTPFDRLDILRRAFLAMANDPEYLAEVSKFDTARLAPHDGDRVLQAMRELAAAATPDNIAEFNRLKK